MAEEEHRDNPVYGRKVFFLDPPYSVRKNVIVRLQELEYEVYTIDDYRDAKNILRHFKDSICFINIDEGLSSDGWFNFIASFEKDETLKSIFLGVISEHARKSDKDLFLLKAKIPAGFVPLNKKIDDITETIKGVLEINGAKGRRQYVRASCANDKDAILLYTTDTKMYQMKLLDLSSVGVAAILLPQFRDAVQTNTVMRNVAITFGKKQIIVDTAVFAIKESPQFQTLVLLFMKTTSASTKSEIREYVFKTLQINLYATIAGETPDQTNYNAKKEPENPKKKDDAFLVEVDHTEVEENYDIHVPPKYDGTPKDLTMTDLF